MTSSVREQATRPESDVDQDELKQSLSNSSSSSSEWEDSSEQEFPVPPIHSLFEGRFRVGRGKRCSRMIETLHLAMDENISQYACLISSVWPGGWLVVRNNHINTVMEVVPYYIPDTEDVSDTGSETLYEDEDEVEGSMFPEGWIAPIYRNFHHLDWYSKPAYHRNATPPEVSLWFARFASKNKSRSYDSLRSFVLTSQAGKLIDPVRYWGPPRFLEMPGTELCDSLAGTGAVDKAYRRWGTWDRDNYSSYEATPIYTSGMGF